MLPGMRKRRHPVGLPPVVLCLGLTLIVAPASVTGQTGAVQITSDTPEYCLHLLDVVSAMVRQAVQPPPRAVSDLSSEGQRMCDHGQTRGGIMRLRKALVLMQHTGE
jgi:hypothetical protein